MNEETSPSLTDPTFLILVLLIAFTPITGVFFTAALPAIAKHFEVSAGSAQLTITIFLVGYALGQIPYGPLASNLGRKKIIRIGILFTIAATMLALIAGALNLFWLFLTARFLMALGACVGLALTFTIIGDLYSDKMAAKAIALTLMSLAIMPNLASLLGAFISEKLGWAACFYALALYGLFVLAIVKKLPETSKSIDKQALQLSHIKTAFKETLFGTKFFSCAVLMGCTTAFVYLFAAEAPFIAIQMLGLKPHEFGLLNMIPPLGMLAGSFIASRLTEKIPVMKLMLLGILCSTIGTLIMFGGFAFDKVNVWTLFFPMPIIFIGGTQVFPCAASLALSSSKHKAHASSLLNFINIGTSTFAVLVLSLLTPNLALVMPLIFVSIIITMIFFWLKVRLSYQKIAN